MTEFRSELKKVKHLGSAKDGTSHWWAMKLTSAALIPLGLWFVFSLISVLNADIAQFYIWLKSPFQSTMMILFLLVMFHHVANGMQVIYEDYIHHELFKIAAVYLTKFACLVMLVASILAVLKIAFTGV